MSITRQILPGIRQIYHIDCDLLPERVDLRTICHMPIEVNCPRTEVNIAGGAEADCTRERSGAGEQDTATLRFLTDRELLLAERPGFVAIDVNGKAWLFGSKEAPRPIIKFNHVSSSPTGERAGWSYEVAHTAIRSMIECELVE